MAVRCGRLGVVLSLLVSLAGSVPAAEAPPELLQTLKSLNYQRGEITLGDNLAKLIMPEEYRYLDPADARKVLVDIWGNPPANGDTLGMILPPGASVIDPDCWAAIITWSGDGYIKDDDAAAIDYATLLRNMQASVRQASVQRVKQGYPSIDLIGWALPPRYDRQAHKLYWAKELKFGDNEEHTLNYCVRLLGRRGVLELNAVGDMKHLESVKQATPRLLSMIDFAQGQRYVDFNPSTDQVAAYGLAALIAGGVAAKAGLFKGLLLALLAAKKFVIIAAIALIAVLRKFIGRLFGRSAA